MFWKNEKIEKKRNKKWNKEWTFDHHTMKWVKSKLQDIEMTSQKLNCK